MKIIQHLVGTRVVVRSRDSGVWLGTLLMSEGSVVRLKDARRAWRWEDATECGGLAQSGPGPGSKFPKLEEDIVVLGVCEIRKATPEACARWDAVPVWAVD